MADAENYKIVKSQLPLLGGLAGHNFIAILDPNDQVIHELHSGNSRGGIRSGYRSRRAC